MLEPRPVIFNELSDHAVGPQTFGHGQHRIGRRRAFRQGSQEPHADHIWDKHGDCLPQHRGPGFQSANPPTKNTKRINHRRMTIHTEHTVRIGTALAVNLVGPDDTRDMFHVHLVQNPHARRNHGDIFIHLLGPFHEAVALAVAVVFERHIPLQGIRLTVKIHIYRVIYDEIDGQARINRLRVAAELFYRVPHGG